MEKPISLCDRCERACGCLLEYDEGVCRKVRTVEPQKADMIRSMSNEGLADLFARHDANIAFFLFGKLQKRTGMKFADYFEPDLEKQREWWLKRLAGPFGGNYDL